MAAEGATSHPAGVKVPKWGGGLFKRYPHSIVRLSYFFSPILLFPSLPAVSPPHFLFPFSARLLLIPPNSGMPNQRDIILPSILQPIPSTTTLKPYTS